MFHVKRTLTEEDMLRAAYWLGQPDGDEPVPEGVMRHGHLRTWRDLPGWMLGLRIEKELERERWTTERLLGGLLRARAGRATDA